MIDTEPLPINGRCLQKHCSASSIIKKTKFRERTIPTEQPPFINKVSVNLLWTERSRVVSTAYTHGRNLSYLYLSLYFFFQVSPQLNPRGGVDPVPDPLLFRKSGIEGNLTQPSRFVARNSDYYTTQTVNVCYILSNFVTVA
jgi:hypothetical protein